MNPYNSSVLLRARSEADRLPVTRWFWIGFFLSGLGLVIAYLRPHRPTVGTYMNNNRDFHGDVHTPSRQGEHDVEPSEYTDRNMYEQAYSEILGGRRIKATWWGFAVSLFLSSIVLSMMWESLLIAVSY